MKQDWEIASDLKIEHNTKMNPVFGKKNNCYDITYKLPDGYGGTCNKGFSVDADVFHLIKNDITKDLKQAIKDFLKWKNNGDEHTELDLLKELDKLAELVYDKQG